MKRRLLIALAAMTAVVLAISTTALAASNARKPAISSGADHIVNLQRADPGWTGTWYWYVGSSYNATNLTGVTALGLLEAYNDTKDTTYLNSAMKAASFIEAHLGSGATGAQYYPRTTAPDIVFLHELSQVTGDSSYATRANAEWSNLTSYWPHASSLDDLFRSINRHSAWDLAYYLEAAHLSGDNAWADEAAAILANTSDSFYYDPSQSWSEDWYALNVAGAVRALVDSGYADRYNDSVVTLLGDLASLGSADNGVGGSVQYTAYAILAFNAVGGSAHQYANHLGRWLASQQLSSGGWIEPDGQEYAEDDGEAVQALASTIDSDVTVDGFQTGTTMNSSWSAQIRGGGTQPFDTP